jgi:hypothetical protein
MLLLLAALPALFWDGAADTAPALHDAGIKQILVPKERLAAWKAWAESRRKRRTWKARRNCSRPQ